MWHLYLNRIHLLFVKHLTLQNVSKIWSLMKIWRLLQMIISECNQLQWTLRISSILLAWSKLLVYRQKGWNEIIQRPKRTINPLETDTGDLKCLKSLGAQTSQGFRKRFNVSTMRMLKLTHPQTSTTSRTSLLVFLKDPQDQLRPIKSN